MYKEKLRKALDSAAAALLMTILIFFSVICFSIETMPNLDEDTKWFLNISELITVLIFTFEYLIRYSASTILTGQDS